MQLNDSQLQIPVKEEDLLDVHVKGVPKILPARHQKRALLGYSCCNMLVAEQDAVPDIDTRSWLHKTGRLYRKQKNQTGKGYNQAGQADDKPREQVFQRVSGRFQARPRAKVQTAMSDRLKTQSQYPRSNSS